MNKALVAAIILFVIGCVLMVAATSFILYWKMLAMPGAAAILATYAIIWHFATKKQSVINRLSIGDSHVRARLPANSGDGC